jgi:hypothetical protein
MVNNSENINKTNNRISPEIIEHNKRSWLEIQVLDIGQAQICDRVTPENGNTTLS